MYLCFLSVIWVCVLLVTKSRRSRYLIEKDIERKFTSIIAKQLESAMKAGNDVCFVLFYLFIFNVSGLTFYNSFSDSVLQKRRHSIGDVTPVYNVIENTKLATASTISNSGIRSPWTGKIERNI